MSSGQLRTLEEVANAYRDLNPDGVLSHFSDDARVIGNLPGEDWDRKADLQPYLEWELDRFEKVDYRFLDATERRFAATETDDLVVAGSTRVALWGTFKGGRPFEYVGRWTYSLRRDGDGWRVILSQFRLES